MQKRAPTLANILVIVLFALSCFGLLLFLWESFGGPVPLKPKGYRFNVEFPRTLQLAEQADVRISGVDVGRVASLSAAKNGLTHVTVEMDHQYAPVRSNVHVILRQKTLLGETYLEILPGSSSAPRLADGGELAASSVEPSQTLDDILSTLDPKTRRAFQVWMQSLSAGFEGRGQDLNASFANIDPFVQHTNQLVSILAAQQGAVQEVVRGTGEVFDALAERDHQFQGLITNGDNTFHALAQNSQAFADAFRGLPAFERNSSVALRRLDRFSTAASPLLDQLRPAERELAPLVKTVRSFSPDFNSLLTNLGPLTKAARKGLPDLTTSLNLTKPVLENLSPVLRNLDPLLQYAGEYVPELQAFFANITAASEAHDRNADDPAGPLQHYLRGLNTVTPEDLAVYHQRIGTNRANPYFQPGAFRALGSGLPVFSGASCANSAPAVEGPPNETVSQSILYQLVAEPKDEKGEPAKNAQGEVLTNTNPVANEPGQPNKVQAPACNQQGPFEFNGQTGQFPRLYTNAGGK